MTREPVAYGFYPSTEAKCLDLINSFEKTDFLENNFFAGVVPHAGWVYSGNIAFNTISKILENKNIETIIILGAAHRYFNTRSAIYSSGNWKTPFGNININEKISLKIIEEIPELIINNKTAHNNEHSIEVNIPFIQYLNKEIDIVPIIVPPIKNSIELGKKLSNIIKNNDNIAIIASADLTHYGANYGIIHRGIGENAHKWIKENSDGVFIKAMLEINAEKAFELAETIHCSCGGGSVSCLLSCLKELNIKKGILVDHKTSADIINDRNPSSFVGYAGVIF